MPVPMIPFTLSTSLMKTYPGNTCVSEVSGGHLARQNRKESDQHSENGSLFFLLFSCVEGWWGVFWCGFFFVFCTCYSKISFSYISKHYSWDLLANL